MSSPKTLKEMACEFLFDKPLLLTDANLPEELYEMISLLKRCSDCKKLGWPREFIGCADSCEECQMVFEWTRSVVLNFLR